MVRALTCFALNSHPQPFWLTCWFITQLKSVLSDAGAPVALVVLHHGGPACNIVYGLISIKLAGDNVIFHSQVDRIHKLLLCSDDPCVLWLVTNIFISYTWSTFPNLTDWLSVIWVSCLIGAQAIWTEKTFYVQWTADFFVDYTSLSQQGKPNSKRTLNPDTYEDGW